MSFRNAILSSLNQLFGLRGLELRSRVRIEDDCSMDAALRRAGARLPRVGTVIDVGAAAGKWTRRARPHFPDARFHLIEPITSAIKRFVACIKFPPQRLKLRCLKPTITHTNAAYRCSFNRYWQARQDRKSVV